MSSPPPPTAWSHIRSLAHEAKRKIQQANATFLPLPWVRTPSRGNLMTLEANELVWSLPDTPGGCRLAATLRAFNDVYVRSERRDEGSVCVL